MTGNILVCPDAAARNVIELRPKEKTAPGEDIPGPLSNWVLARHETLARRFRQDRRDPRHEGCLLRLGHAAVQHDDLDGAPDPECSVVLAQFEREVIGERIRDKIAASKRKGMWMGGVPPFRYRAQDRKLVIIDSEAELVRSIFRRYAELGSVRLLKEELDTTPREAKASRGRVPRVG